MTELAERVNKNRNFFEPEFRIAVVGVSDKKGKVGNAVITNLTKESVKTAGVGKAGLFKKIDETKGFDGNIYLVNNKSKTQR